MIFTLEDGVGDVWRTPTEVALRGTLSSGSPYFKTEKLLGGRCLVTDSFSISAHNPNTFTKSKAGMGIYGHRDGYNALYGDWHVKWYGDPQQRYIWASEFMAGGAMDRHNSPDSGDYIWEVLATPTSTTPAPDPATIAWHGFDVAAQIDVLPDSEF